MATNADFDALIVRIDTATTTLENSVQAVAEGSADVEAAVTEAESFANTATQQATLASNSATAATNASGAAQTQANRAQGIADNLLATAPFDEAPQDGFTYGRNNADWVVVDAGGAAVSSVNGEAPDASGNVALSIPDATSELTNDSGFITQAAVPTAVSALSNDAGYITQADIPANVSAFTNDAGYITAGEVPPSGVQEAPTDGQQYARQNEEWSPVQSPTAPLVGDEVGALRWSATSPTVGFDAWATAGAWFAQPIQDLDPLNPSITNGDWAPYFSSAANLSKIPAGLYSFTFSTGFKDSAHPLYQRNGILAVINASPTKNIVAGQQENKPPVSSGSNKTVLAFSWPRNGTMNARSHILIDNGTGVLTFYPT